MTNDKATTRQIEYVGKLTEFAISLPTHQRANVFGRLRNWARSFDNQFQIEDQIDESRFVAYTRNEVRVNRPDSDPRPMRYWRIMIGMPGYLPNSCEVFAGKSESAALDYALACADFNLALSRRARRKIRRDLQDYGEAVLSSSPYEVIWFEEISQQEYENSQE